MRVQAKVNGLPAPTKRWLKMNYAEFDAEFDFSNAEFEFSPLPEGIEVSSGAIASEFEEKLAGIKTGCGAELDPLFSQAEPLFILAKKNCDSKEPLLLSHKAGAVSRIAIVAEEGARASFALEFSSAQDLAAVRICVLAKENAQVALSVVNLLGAEAAFLCDAGFVAENSARIQLNQIQVGARNSWLGQNVLLSGEDSSFDGRMGYAARENQALDENYVAEHRGRRSQSRFYAEGALSGAAAKTFRDTINFIHGAEGAFGDEQENVLLLGDKAVNKSIPLILCDEEDVEGQHGASIGRLDSRLLLYMQSRGISRAEAQRLCVCGKIGAVSARLGIAALEEKVSAEIEKLYGGSQ